MHGRMLFISPKALLVQLWIALVILFTKARCVSHSFLAYQWPRSHCSFLKDIKKVLW